MAIVDKGQILGRDDVLPLQADRTRRNVCARCGKGSSKHGRKDGKCPDGAGVYAWCHSNEDTKKLIAALKGFLATAARHKFEAERPENADARRVIDILVTASTGSLAKESPRQFLARMRGVEESALGDLGPNELGPLEELLAGNTFGGGASGERLVASMVRLCGWSEFRAIEAIDRAIANGWIAKPPGLAPPAGKA